MNTLHPKWFLSVAAILLLMMGNCHARANEPESYSRLRLSVGGFYVRGNLNQLQGNFQGHYGLSSPTSGIDVLFNGFRLWTKANKDAAYKAVAGDAFITALPFFYLTERFYLMGLGRTEASKSTRLNQRYIAGGGIGYTPVRRKDFLLRCSFMPAFEFAQFEDENFRIDIDHKGAERTVLRAALVSNGWYRVKASPVTFRYFANIWPNPFDTRDFRANVNANIDIQIIAAVALRVSLFLSHESAILEGREPTDLRSIIGLTWATD